MQQQNGEVNNYPSQPPNNNFSHQRFMGPRGPRPPVMHNNAVNNNNNTGPHEALTRDTPSPAKEQNARYVCSMVIKTIKAYLVTYDS